MVKFIVITLGIGWLLIQLMRFFLRTKLAKFVQQVNQAARDQQQGHYHQHNKTGEVRVDHVPDNFKKSKQKDQLKGGEYVDFEEVKD
ncbi:DUF4834 family protein [Belliella kenyensis]|uniref:DUF4834 family protein n=1 Tax=Belliella kenyensis TaxID=1472724 RepID=A0ABV8ESD9_9BACT|nr:DUF4834 family protein [Belliella kenyensis]MCH7402567.1 DUF4834 family protein [Belliella kenyensis]MDN3603365.1 DUF4834 family protein [Belliella kenyensis]